MRLSSARMRMQICLLAWPLCWNLSCLFCTVHRAWCDPTCGCVSANCATALSGLISARSWTQGRWSFSHTKTRLNKLLSHLRATDLNSKHQVQLLFNKVVCVTTGFATSSALAINAHTLTRLIMCLKFVSPSGITSNALEEIDADSDLK